MRACQSIRSSSVTGPSAPGSAGPASAGSQPRRVCRPGPMATAASTPSCAKYTLRVTSTGTSAARAAVAPGNESSRASVCSGPSDKADKASR